MRRVKRLNVRIEEDIFYRLKALGRKSMSDFVRRAIIHRLSIKTKVTVLKKKAG
jgi:predicted CopG family antitoxin